MKTQLTELEKTMYNYWIENDKNKSKLIDYIARGIHYDDYTKLKGHLSNGKAKELIKKFKAIEVDAYTVSKGFILEAHKDACSTWKTKIENQFPELFPKVELEIGKWYKSTNNNGFMFYIKELKENKYIGYGKLETYGKFHNQWWFTKNSVYGKSLVLATKEEVETALTKLLKDKYKKGNKVRCLFDNKVVTIKNMKIDFCFNRNRVYVNQVENNDTVKIFDNGKFAEIISEPIELSLDEIAEKFGVDVSLIKIKK